MIEPDTMDWQMATTSTTVTILITMLADSAEQIRILRFRLSFTLRKNQMGSALKSTSATQSAIAAKSKCQQKDLRVLSAYW